MSKLVHNYNGGLTDEYGTQLVLTRLLGGGGVIEGFAVAANSSPNMTVYVRPGSAAIATGTYPSSYSYLCSIDTALPGEAVTIATANTSPRIDYVVAYIDKSVAGSTAPANTNNANGVLKLASVAGTPAGSPVVPTTAQIQAVVGASNPYAILAQIAVAASVTSISNTNITDKRTFAGVASSNINWATLHGVNIGNGWNDYGAFIQKSVTAASLSLSSGTAYNIITNLQLPSGYSGNQCLVSHNLSVSVGSLNVTDSNTVQLLASRTTGATGSFTVTVIAYKLL
jgi:hypothetical protein